ncbi:NAD(P)/FAD-dependent oxidoreductase [Hymenobacter guriensis]|uniref:Geranylgeranyl reductase family protein n=1 Tax=Hymenobacter guriensis TaxID=2793065 RepID=A0ABS0KY18_9BACT|nr:geranylgeranyl reductase family protein [Hymenobacter guriensis]MBG8552645.1 geranylgeranyl reductase family protein [Hymenobacter guriensis]
MTLLPHHYDVLILGAGPAGTAAALALHGHGLRVALVDKAHFPRDKVCGDAIPGPTLTAIRRLSESWYQELVAVQPQAPAKASRLVGPGGQELVVHWQKPTFNSPRQDFDFQLLQLVRRHTQTTILENHAVRDVRTDEQGVELVLADPTQLPLSAQLLLACDGANSVAVRKVLPRPLDRRYHCAAVRAYYTGLTGFDEHTSEFYFLRDYPAGYCWVFPVGGGVYNVGFGLLSAQVAERRVDMKQALAQLLRQHPQLVGRFAGARQLSEVTGFGLPLAGRRLPLAATRCLLAGDAASLIDPLQGHGIDKAVISGILAAEQVVRCFQSQDFSLPYLRQYEAAVQQKLGRRLQRSYRLMRLLAAWPGLLQVGFWLARLPGLQRRLVRLIG